MDVSPAEVLWEIVVSFCRPSYLQAVCLEDGMRLHASVLIGGADHGKLQLAHL